MSITIKNVVWQTCESLTKKKQLITTKNVLVELNKLNNWSEEELNNFYDKISDLISKWRISILSSATPSFNDVNIYGALAIPKKANYKDNIYELEHELNRYKHLANRANKRVKLLEKKLHAVITKSNREREEMIACIKSLLP